MASKYRQRRPNRRDPTGISATHVEEAMKGVDQMTEGDDKKLAQDINTSIEHKFKNEKFNLEAAQEPRKPFRPFTRYVENAKCVPVPAERSPPSPRKFERTETTSREVVRNPEINDNDVFEDEDDDDSDDDLISELEDQIAQLKLQLAQKDLIINQKDLEISRLRRANRRTKAKETDF